MDVGDWSGDWFGPNLDGSNDRSNPNLKHRTSNLEPQTSNLKPQTSNLKPQTSNLKPQTSNLKPWLIQWLIQLKPWLIQWFKSWAEAEAKLKKNEKISIFIDSKPQTP